MSFEPDAQAFGQLKRAAARDPHLQSAPDSAYVTTECVPTAHLEYVGGPRRSGADVAEARRPGSRAGGTARGSGLVLGALFFLAVTIPLARVVDWLISREQAKTQRGGPKPPAGEAKPAGPPATGMAGA